MNALKKTDKILLLISIILFSTGLIMVFSASNVAAFVRYNKNPLDFMLKQSLSLVLGIIGFLVIINFTTKSYSAVSWLMLLISIGLILFALFNGSLINDSKSWIYLGPLSFQPSELAKVILIVWYSAFFELNRKKLNKIFTNLFPIGMSCLVAALVVLQNDFGTAAIIMGISFLLYIIMPINKSIKFRVVFISVLIIAVVLVGYYLFDTSSFTRQISRFDFFKPCSEEKFYTTGNQVCNSYIAFNNGDLLGKGLGNSTQKYLYLPEAHTDFIFAIIIEELGFITGAAIIVLYVILLWRIILIGKRSTSSRGSIICYGTAIYIFLHVVINLFGIMGWLPLTGVPLPFLSYGGTFTICLIASLSMVQRVAIETNFKKMEK